jgi:PAS domain S-box-containing protein
MSDTIATINPGTRCESLETRYERLRYAFGNLIESYEELSEQLHEMHDIHLVTDGTGVLLQVNATASLLSPARQMIGTRLSEWVVRSHRDRFQLLLADIPKLGGNRGKMWNMRMQRDTPDARQIDVALHAMAIVSDGEVSVIHWVLRPLTQQVEESFQLLRPPVEFENITECAFKTDTQGIILEVNAAFTRTTGYTAPEAVGKRPSILSSGLQDDAFYKDFWGDLLGSGHWQGLIFNRKKNGEVYCEWVNIHAELDSNGQQTGYIAVFFDLGLAASKKQQLLAKSSPRHVYRTQPIPAAAG